MSSPELLPSLVKILSALTVTVLIMFGAAWLFRKAAGKTAWGINNELINILAVKYLGAKNSIMLVDIAGNVMVIGVSNGTINMLTEIMDGETLERLKDRGQREGTLQSFSDHLALFKERLFSPGKGRGA